MGQRLVLRICDNGEEIANAYFHWSGYTSSAARITSNFIEAWDELCGRNRSNVVNAVMALHALGSGFNSEELDDICKDTDLKSELTQARCMDMLCINRNEGLTAVTEHGMAESMQWAEETVAVDVSTRVVDFGVVCLEDADELGEGDDDGEDIVPDKVNFSLEDLTMDNFDSAERYFCGKRNYYFWKIAITN